MRRRSSAAAKLLLDGALLLGRLQVREVALDERQRRPPLDHLEGPVELLAHDAGAQRRVPVDDLLPRSLEGADVELAVGHGPALELDEVDTGLPGIEDMEQDAVLHGRQRVHVLDRPRPAAARGEVIHGRLVQRRAGSRWACSRRRRGRCSGRRGRGARRGSGRASTAPMVPRSWWLSLYMKRTPSRSPITLPRTSSK